jgi:hypothetical protein
MDAAVVRDTADNDGSDGIVRARDSANIPPPQPTSRYFRPGIDVVLEVVSGFSDDVVIGESTRHSPMKSCRSGFIKCSTRDGPMGSHQLLARPEKCESSSADTDEEEEEEEWCRTELGR